MKLAIISTDVFTGIPATPWAEAVLIEDGKIVLTGNNEDVLHAAGENAQIVRLNGGMVTPGLVDSHCHMASLGITLQRVCLIGVSSLKECRQIIRDAAAKLAPGEWLLGRGWNNHLWEEAREPDKLDLDDIVPDNPVAMTRACGHLIWLNSKALERAGIDASTPEPAGGQIDRQIETNIPTGIIRESLELIANHLPQVSRERKKEAILKAQALSLSYGLTGVHTCETLSDYLAFAELAAEGKLKIRVCHLLPPEDLKAADERDITPGNHNDRLWHTHVKLFMDGSLGANTAYMHEPYEDSPLQYGIACMTKDEALSHIKAAYAAGRSVAIHAIGDRAVTESLDAIEEARKTWPGPWRDRIEHVQFCRPEDLDRFANMDIVASVQPGFLPTDWRTAEKKLGKERCTNSYAWKSILNKGIKMQFGSDTPVEPNNPLIGLQAAVTRCDSEGLPLGGWFSDQKLTLEQALSGYTLSAAWTGSREQSSGTLAPGMLADLTIFEQHLGEVPENQISQVKVRATLVGGEIVFGELDSERDIRASS